MVASFCDSRRLPRHVSHAYQIMRFDTNKLHTDVTQWIPKDIKGQGENKVPKHEFV